VLKKVVIASVAALMIALGVGAYLWREATALPDWYTEADAASLDEYAAADEAEDAAPVAWVPDARPPEAPPELENPSATSPKRARTKRSAGRHELRGFHRRAKKGDGRSPVKASRAIYEDGQLQAGVVFDLSRIPKDELVARDRELYDRAVEHFPGITRRDVYIGIEDRPVSTEGVLQLGPDPQVRVGNLRYSLDTAAGKIGMSSHELRRELDRELHRLGFVDPIDPPG
jgi:hypothetical protein